LAAALRTGGVAFGAGLVRDIDPFAVRVVPDPEGFVGGGVALPAPPWDDVEFVDVVGGGRESDAELEILAGRRVGRAGGEVVAMSSLLVGLNLSAIHYMLRMLVVV
jgi:hypothetical protein